MNRQNRKRGFTMAEMLIVVAIIGVLAAVSFIAVNQHQRSMERLDRDSVAREIFIAAQNHLTMAESQGYLGVTGENIYGKVESEKDHIYYFAVNKGSGFSSSILPETLLDLMLPPASIDETVRGGGSYIIRYKPKYDTKTETMSYGTVMDVFYCSSDERFGYDLSETSASGLKTLLDDWSGDGNASKRRNFNGAVLGWYGGATAVPLSKAEIYAPLIVVENADKLRIGIKEGTGENSESNPDSSSLQVIVKGMRSGVQKVFTLKSDKSTLVTEDDRISHDSVKIEGIDCDCSIILDDITTENMHFADLTIDNADGTEKRFIPGEDIIVQAIAFDNTQISNIGYSAEITVNSLYEKLEAGTANNQSIVSMTASISSIRHLENLDKRISDIDDSRFMAPEGSNETYKLNNAIQNSDLSWTKFKGNTRGGDTVIQQFDKTATANNKDSYMPVVPTNPLVYKGQKHSVSEINVSNTSNAGMFGKLISGSCVSDLQLIDFNIDTTSGNAGALVGTLEQGTQLTNKEFSVRNVLAYNSTSKINTVIKTTGENGHAGGLIGLMTGNEANGTNGYGKVEKSAASFYVTSEKGNAGGLIGTTYGGSVSGSFSGGHTTIAAYSKTGFNVKAEKGNAGGLIGLASSTPIEYCYSTCSATGITVGGMIGSGTDKIQHSYCTGLVKSTATTPVEGAFAGAWSYASKTATDDNHYLDIINEWETVDASNNITGYRYLDPVSGSATILGISAIDYSATTYNAFCGDSTVWKSASPYDVKLAEYYGGKYNLKTVEQLGYNSIYADDQKDTDGKITAYADFVIQHYGDWPAPEIFVVNTAS